MRLAELIAVLEEIRTKHGDDLQVSFVGELSTWQCKVLDLSIGTTVPGKILFYAGTNENKELMNSAQQR